MKTLLNHINGQWVAARSGATRDILNPADNKVIVKATDSGAADAEDAVTAAREAFDQGPWGKSTGPERAEKLFALANLVEKHAEEFARLDTENNGKPLREARYDAADAASCFRYYAGLASKPQGQTYSVSDPNMVCLTVREPIGVCAQIIPWNYPLLMAVWKLAPGLAAGNACILKPSEMTPVSAVKLFELMEEAGFPPGAANLILGPGDPVGSTLAASDRVDKVAFTGGGVTGRKIMSAATGNLKKVTLELGGKSPNIVFADADFDAALEFAMFGIFAGQGEVCSAGSRLILERKIAEKFLPRLAEACRKIVVGDGAEAETEMGPLVSRAHMEKVLGYIKSGLDEGAKLLCGGHRIEKGALAEGNFVEPTVFVDVPPKARIMKEEIFGPVLVVELFDTEEEAIALANDSVYGLAASVWTADLRRAHRFVQELQAGVVWVNCFGDGDMTQPFGGYKQSGNSRDKHMMSLMSYTQVKSAWFNLG
jgi:betaine-aldehyde dehydrogenase